MTVMGSDLVVLTDLEVPVRMYVVVRREWMNDPARRYMLLSSSHCGRVWREAWKRKDVTPMAIRAGV